MKLKKFIFNKVKSTNATAINIIKRTKNKNGFVISNEQTKGKGQYGKTWISYKGNIFVSIFFSLECISLSINQLTKINCLLVKKLLSIYYKKKIIIKPPNDLIIKKKKVCGILQEKIINDNESFIIVGIGINIIKNPYIKNYPTTNLSDITKMRIKKKELILNLQKIYEEFIPKFSKFNNELIKQI
jgi:BirA family transcriptional regulator, biotin operon repressor / biotin---[acetyl-CoA-carboxylase] ligase